MWKVEFDKDAAKELERLSHDVQVKILLYLKNRIETNEDPERFGQPLNR